MCSVFSATSRAPARRWTSGASAGVNRRRRRRAVRIMKRTFARRFAPRESRPLLLLLGRREQHVVEDQPVARRVRVLVELRRRVAHHVLVVLGIVAAEERERALAELAVQVLHLVRA